MVGTTTEKITSLAKQKGLIRPRDLESLSIPGQYLARLCEQGILERRGRGLYALPHASVSEHETLAQTAILVPHGVICLLSSLQFHGLTTQRPFEVWMTITQTAWKPNFSYPPVRVLRVNDELHQQGVELHDITGVSVPIYSAARTVCDCFKHRSKVGIDVAIEALRDAWRSKTTSMDDIWAFSKMLRVSNIMRPYIQSLG